MTYGLLIISIFISVYYSVGNHVLNPPRKENLTNTYNDGRGYLYNYLDLGIVYHSAIGYGLSYSQCGYGHYCSKFLNCCVSRKRPGQCVDTTNCMRNYVPI